METDCGAAYDEGCDGGDGEREVAAEVGVGEEGADDGGEAGGAVEPVEQRGRVHAPHVEHLRQVHQQVRRRAQRPQLLERLVPCVWMDGWMRGNRNSVSPATATVARHTRAHDTSEGERAIGSSARTDDEGHGLPAVVLDGGPRRARALLAAAVLQLVDVHALELPGHLLVVPPAAHAHSSRGRLLLTSPSSLFPLWSVSVTLWRAPVSNEKSIMPTGL